MTVRLDEMSWPEVQESLTKPNAVLLPLGSTEEHGAHLPLNVDSIDATYIVEHAAQKAADEHNICALVAPTIDYTDVSAHKMFPGTIGVKVETLIRVIVDIVGSFLDQGFKNIIVVNNHSENSCSMEAALRIVADERPGANVFGVASALGFGADARQGLVKAGPVGLGHALVPETSFSLIIQPQNVHLDKAKVGSRQLPLSERYIGVVGTDKSKGVIYYPEGRIVDQTGTAGDPTTASKEIGKKSLSATISDLADIIVQVAKPEQRA